MPDGAQAGSETSKRVPCGPVCATRTPPSWSCKICCTIGNPSPVFLARGVDLLGPAREVGKGHLKLRLSQGGHSLDAIGFNLVHRVSPESLGTGPVDLVFKLKLGFFRGRRQVEAHVLDVRPSDLAESVPGAGAP